ncbi:hypothetical protein [Microcoleus anatoxicus]|uniref:hypothetical protein n=1 Tax=Microcoleus anatoxicus TaxID=2705319 RepID=UPI0030C94AA8
MNLDLQSVLTDFRYETGNSFPVGLSDCRIVGLSDCRIVGLSDCRIVGLSDCRTVGLSDCRTICQTGTSKKRS